MERFEKILMERYSGHSFEILSRVRLFFRFGIILLPFLVAFIVFLNLTLRRNLFSTANVAVVILMIVTVLCLFILYSGRYNFSVNIMVLVMLLATFIIANRTIQHGSPTRLLASTIPAISIVVFGVLFCRRRIANTVTALAIAGFFFNIISSGLLNTAESGSALTALSLSTVLTALLSTFIVRIGEQSKLLRNREHDIEMNRHMSANIGLIESLTEVSVKLDETSRQMSESSFSFSENMQGEATSMEEITATVEEVSSGLDNVSINARDQSELMEALTGKIDEMYRSSRDMAASMTEALRRTSDIMARAQSGGKSLEDMEKSMKAISDTSREMTGIVNMINDISDRINLLSLNASIEAARAGEYGRGFAVVADEISKLADQTTGSVKEIDRLIKQSDAEISRGMDNAGSTVEAITGIIDSINEIGVMIGTMSENVEKNVSAGEEVNRSADNVRMRSDEITTATEEHKKAAAEIVRSITNVNHLIQANAIRAQDMTEHLQSIADMAEKVKTSMKAVDMSALKMDGEESM